MNRAHIARRAPVVLVAGLLLAATPGMTVGRALSSDPAAPISAAEAPCTVLVTAATEVVDGARPEFAGLGPGSVVCLAAGARGNIKIANLHGTPEQPITVRNEGGDVLLTGTRFEAAIYIVTSTALRITGTGVVAQCGARFSTQEQRCGIEIDGATKGIKAATSRGDLGHLEIDHVGIHRVQSDEETRGIAIHPVSRQVVTGIRIHDNYVSNTAAEGIYVGSEPRGMPYEELGKVADVEIAYNLVEQIGWDGIKLKVAITHSTIHHNIIRDAALASYENHESGITVSMSRADVYSNTILRTVDGIKTGRPLEDPGNRYYNNVVADVEAIAIDIAEGRSVIYNNTIVRTGGIGIRARGDRSVLTDNIVADAARGIAVRGMSIDRTNLVAPTSEILFTDPLNHDYTLTAGSPAVDRGRLVNRDVCLRAGMRVARPMAIHLREDNAGSARPSGCRSDLGAFELTQSSVLYKRTGLPRG